MDPAHGSRRFGWWSLLVWLGLGLVLEAMHGFKVGWYLDVGNDGRRLQLTLAHVHGTLVALVNLAFAANARPTEATLPALRSASWLLRWAAVLMPVGFLFGGVFQMGGDPGFAIVLVPVGGLMLLAGVFLTARAS
jgi:hypothetical protein